MEMGQRAQTAGARQGTPLGQLVERFMRLSDYHMSFFYGGNEEAYFVDGLAESFTAIRRRGQGKLLAKFQFMEPKDAVAYAMAVIEHDQGKEIEFWKL